MVALSGTAVARKWMIHGVDVTEAVLNPAKTLSDAAGWSGKLSSFAGVHARIAEAAAAAESDGLAVCSRSGALAPVLYSSGSGAPYRIMPHDEYSEERKRLEPSQRNYLLIETKQSLGTGLSFSSAQRLIAGQLDGDTVRAPAKLKCRSLYPEEEDNEELRKMIGPVVSCSYFRAGVRLEGPIDEPRSGMQPG